ncbi:MAG: response regulator [Desulfobacteraceae bacterium]|nr:response regulator [Desulfobacteraceae bacterium]
MKNKSVSILVIEDNPGDARLIKELLFEIKGIFFTTEICQMLSKGVEALTSEKFDVVLLDPGLPDCSGLESLLKTQAAAPHAAIIVLTGLDDGETAVRLVRKGAQDYLVSPSFRGKSKNRLRIF